MLIPNPLLDGFTFFVDAFEYEGDEKNDCGPRFSLRSRSFDDDDDDDRDGFLIPLPMEPRDTTDGKEFLLLREAVGGGELQP